MKYKIDASGRIKAINPVDETEGIIIETDLWDSSLSIPKWNGEKWVESITEGELSKGDEQPTSQEQLNATVLAQIAQNKADQDKFNAQILLAMAKGGN